MINVIIIDDHKFLLQGLEQMLNQSGKVIVSNIGYSAADCRRLLENRLPEVLILDVKLPDDDGCVLCAELVKKYPTLRVLMLTSYIDTTAYNRAMQSGARGYILKNSDYDDFLEGIQVVALGGRYVCEDMEKLLKKNPQTDVKLSKREHELLKHISAGHTSGEIAVKMGITEQTIKGYRKNLHRKFDVRNTAQLMCAAMDMGLV
ncbi:MAG: response regulator transcription factor [Bacteroidales bacterium]|nr:response regulator transcription factor [Bacteroidales bacterium]